MLKYIKKNTALLFLSILGSILIAAVEIGVAFTIQEIIDSATSGNLGKVGQLCIFIFVLILVDIMANSISAYFLHKFCNRVSTSLRDDIIKNILSMKLNRYRKNDTSFYTNMLTTDVTTLYNDYFINIQGIVFDIIQIIFGLTAVIYISWKITLAIVITIIIPLLIPMISSPIINRIKIAYSNDASQHLAILKQLLEGFELIHCNQLQKKSLELYKEKSDKLGKQYAKYFWYLNFFSTINMDLTFFTMAILFGFGAYLIIQNEITVGGLIAVVNLLNNILQPLNAVSSKFIQVKSSKGIVTKINSILLPDEIADSNLSLLNEFHGTITVQHLTFGYTDKKIICDFSAEFLKNKKYAIIGPSGSGKSTLLKIIAGFITGYEGQISFDKYPLTSLDLDSVINHITFLQQDTFLFDDTLGNNITLYKNYSLEEIEHAVHLAQLDSCFSSELDLSKNIGEFGNLLSGGEKQRVAIARGILRKSSIYLLDEITSALDPDTERKIFETLLNLEDITLIAIVHNWNPEFLSNFDQVIDFNNQQSKL